MFCENRKRGVNKNDTIATNCCEICRRKDPFSMIKMPLSRVHTSTAIRQPIMYLLVIYKMSLSCNGPGSVPLSGSAPGVNGVNGFCSGSRPILHPSLVDIRTFCVILLTNWQTNQKTQKDTGENLTTSEMSVITHSCFWLVLAGIIRLCKVH